MNADAYQIIVFSLIACGIVIMAVGARMLCYGYFDETDKEGWLVYSPFSLILGFCVAFKRLFTDRKDPMCVGLIIYLFGMLLIGVGWYLGVHLKVLESLSN